jgi:hypothetical protein
VIGRAVGCLNSADDAPQSRCAVIGMRTRMRMLLNGIDPGACMHYTALCRRRLYTASSLISFRKL